MLQTVQLSITDSGYAGALRDALARSCAWHVESVANPSISQHAVLVLDEAAFLRLPLPVSHPERVVLITRKETELLAEAWDAGIVSVVSHDDSLDTILLAIMAAALRVAKCHFPPTVSGISPNPASAPAPIAPENRTSGSKRCKIQ